MELEDSPRVRLCAAFRTAYETAGLTQDALGERTGLPQARISKYARGESTPPLNVLELVDAACRQPKGYVLRLAGYVDDDLDIAAAIAADRSISGSEDRAMLVRIYRRFQAAVPLGS